MAGTANSSRVFGYGVRRAPFLVEGFPALAAFDAFGNIRKVRRLRPGDDVEALGERLWAWLREHHPERPRLELVKQAPAAPQPSTVSYRGRQVDARLLTDPRSPIARALYRDRLVKAAARRVNSLSFRRDDI
jgi:hypothetical protein